MAQSHANTNGDVIVTPHLTPNPNSARFSVNRVILRGSGRDFPDREDAEGSALPERLFAHPDVSAVYIGRDFVTVTTENGGNPLGLADFVIDAIKAHIASGEKPVAPEPRHAPDDDADDDFDGDGDGDEGDHAEAEGEIENRIIAILDKKVRPAVAMDGGDVVFAGYEGGVVMLHMRGACSGCPSSILTLKMGIENLLKEEIPEVVAVEAV